MEGSGDILTGITAFTLFFFSLLQTILYISAKIIFLKNVLSMAFSSSQFISDSLIPAIGLQTLMPSGDLTVRCD